MINLVPTKIERMLVARALCEAGELIGSTDEIWSHPSAFRALATWRLCINAITALIAGKHGVQASFIKSHVMKHTAGMSNLGSITPFCLDSIAEFMVTDTMARLYWDSITNDPHYPQRCPRCGAAAFIGYTQIDCKARCKP